MVCKSILPNPKATLLREKWPSTRSRWSAMTITCCLSLAMMEIQRLLCCLSAILMGMMTCARAAAENAHASSQVVYVDRRSADVEADRIAAMLPNLNASLLRCTRFRSRIRLGRRRALIRRRGRWFCRVSLRVLPIGRLRWRLGVLIRFSITPESARICVLSA
jgi:hypothetical protein